MNFIFLCFIDKQFNQFKNLPRFRIDLIFFCFCLFVKKRIVNSFKQISHHVNKLQI